MTNATKVVKMTQSADLTQVTRKLRSQRSNVQIAVVIGFAAIIINFVFGFSVDSVFWTIAIVQLYRWYSMSGRFITSMTRRDFDKLGGNKRLFLILWIVAAGVSAATRGLQPDAAVGILVSAAATYLMNQFEFEAETVVTSD